MPERPKWLPNERVDLDDLKFASSGYTAEETQHLLMRMFQGDEPGGTILDGFRIQVLDQAVNPGEIVIHNGYAVDRLGDRTYKQAGDTNAPESLHERSSPTSKSMTLTGDGTHWVEIALQLVPGAKGSRAFWDATFDNGLDTPSGDTLPDGREFVWPSEVPTRDLIDWTPYSNKIGFSWISDIGNGTYSVRIPLARIILTGGVVNTTPSFCPTEPASTTVVATPVAVGSLPNYSVRVADARLFTSTLSVQVKSKLGADRMNPAGAVNVWPITSIDHNNNVLVFTNDPTAAAPSAIVATDSVQQIGASAKQFLAVFRGGGFASGDRRTKLWAQDDITRPFPSHTTDVIYTIKSEAYIADPTGITPPTNNYVNSNTGSGADLLAKQEGPYRTDTELKTLIDWVRAVEYVIREMKHGVSPATNADGAAGYSIESWVGTHIRGEVDTSRNIPTHGSLAEVANARAIHPFGQSAHRIYHDTLQERLRADKQTTITVGDGSSTFGDFNGAQGLANALDYIYDHHTDEPGGTLYVKGGVYDLSGVTLLTHSLKLAKNWSLIGDADWTKIIIPTTGSFNVILSDDATNNRIGTKIKDVLFESKAQRSGANASLVVFSIPTTVDNKNWGGPLIDVINCSFRNEYGASAATDLGLVRVALGEATAFIAKNPINFRDCTFISGDANDVTAGQVQFEWSAKNIAGVIPASPALALSPVCFYDCHFTCPYIGTPGTSIYGVRIVTEGLNTSYRYGEFKFSGCLFDGLGTAHTSAPASAAARVGAIIAQGVAQSAPPIQLSIVDCTFRSLEAELAGGQKTNIAGYIGGGIIFDSPKGKLHVSSCKFQDMQWGIWAASGKHTLSANTFDSCAVGVKLGEGTNTSQNYCKTQLTGCTFTGTIEESDLNITAALQAARSVGVMVAVLDLSHTYGALSDNTIPTDMLFQSSLKISGCTFSELGCGISMYPAAAFLDTGPADQDGAVMLESFEVTGSTFRAIPGCAIDTGFAAVQTSSPTIRRINTVGKMALTGNTFDWCTWQCHRDVFTHTTGTYPSNQITHQHQMCVSTNAHRVFITNNTFLQIGIRTPTDLSTFGYFTTGESQRFLGVLGNAPLSSIKTVVVKGNTFNGYSNHGSAASNPTNLTTYSSTGKTMSWAGCFWVGNLHARYNTMATSVTISNNTITGEFLDVDTSHNTYGCDCFGQSGFWIGPSAGYSETTGALKVTGNDFELNHGQHALYVANDSTVAGQSGSLEFSDISILGNHLRSTNSSEIIVVNSGGGYPSAATAGEIQLVYLDGCWNTYGHYRAVASDGAIPTTPIATNFPLSVSGINVQGNVFYIAGVYPKVADSTTTAADFLLGERGGVVLGGFDTLSVLGGVRGTFNGNTFKNCSLTLGDTTNPTATAPLGISYSYVVTGNSFSAELPGDGTPTSVYEHSGYFRGLFAHNHVHGYRRDAGSRSLDEGSTCVFTNNTVMNGTAVFRAGLNNAHKWLDVSISYFLYLVGNFFHGRGGGENGVSAAPAVNTVKACFDFLGGAGVTDLTAPISGSDNLQDWGDPVNPYNKSMVIALNHFPGSMALTSIIEFGSGTTNVGGHAPCAHLGMTTTSLVGGAATGEGADNGNGLVVGGNMQVSMTVATTHGHFNVKGTTI